MNNDFGQAFLLLFVGMITVFAVLTLITLFGKWLILIVNKYFPQKQKTLRSKTRQGAEIDPKKLTVLIAAVDIITHGKGKITSVKKLDNANE